MSNMTKIANKMCLPQTYVVEVELYWAVSAEARVRARARTRQRRICFESLGANA